MMRNRAISSSIAFHPLNRDTDCTRRRYHERGVDKQARAKSG
jgi:hypothetical protein